MHAPALGDCLHYLHRASSLAVLTCLVGVHASLRSICGARGSASVGVGDPDSQALIIIIITGHYSTATQSRIQSFAVAQKLS